MYKALAGILPKEVIYINTFTIIVSIIEICGVIYTVVKDIIDYIKEK